MTMGIGYVKFQWVSSSVGIWGKSITYKNPVWTVHLITWRERLNYLWCFYNTMMVSQVTLYDCDMTCGLMKVLALLLDTILFPASSYPTKSEGLK